MAILAFVPQVSICVKQLASLKRLSDDYRPSELLLTAVLSLCANVSASVPNASSMAVPAVRCLTHSSLPT